jgi:hypothetical protein
MMHRHQTPRGVGLSVEAKGLLKTGRRFVACGRGPPAGALIVFLTNANIEDSNGAFGIEINPPRVEKVSEPCLQESSSLR